jgi:hypothetical protein
MVTEYAKREYGVTAEQMAALEVAIEKRYQLLKGADKLRPISPDKLKKLIDDHQP